MIFNFVIHEGKKFFEGNTTDNIWPTKLVVCICPGNVSLLQGFVRLSSQAWSWNINIQHFNFRIIVFVWGNELIYQENFSFHILLCLDIKLCDSVHLFFNWGATIADTYSKTKSINLRILCRLLLFEYYDPLPMKVYGTDNPFEVLRTANATMSQHALFRNPCAGCYSYHLCNQSGQKRKHYFYIQRSMT